QRAALELDARLEPADGEEEHARHDEQRGEREVPELALDEAEQHQAVTRAVARPARASVGPRPSAGFSSTPQRRRRRSDEYSMAAWSSSCVTNTAVKKETTTPTMS